MKVSEFSFGNMEFLEHTGQPDPGTSLQLLRAFPPFLCHRDKVMTLPRIVRRSPAGD